MDNEATDVTRWLGEGVSGDDNSSLSMDEPTDSGRDSPEMESSSVGESTDEWSRLDADTASFSTNTQDHSASGEDENSEESSDG